MYFQIQNLLKNYNCLDEITCEITCEIMFNIYIHHPINEQNFVNRNQMNKST